MSLAWVGKNGYWNGTNGQQYDPEGASPGQDGAKVGVYNGHGADQSFLNEILAADPTSTLSLDIGPSYYNAGNNPLHAWDLDRLSNDVMPVTAYTTKNQGGGGPESFMSWADIGNGVYDAKLTALGNKYATYDTEIWFAFDHEAEVKRNRGEVPETWTSADYRAAFRQVVTIMRPLAPKVKFAFWVGGADTTKINEHYPGDEYVDMIGWDPYVHMGWAASTTATQRWSVFSNWLDGRSWGHGKPRGLFEWGYDSRHGSANGVTFMESIPAGIKNVGLEWIILFNRDSGPNTNAKLIHDPVKAAFGEAMQAVQNGEG